MSKWTSSKETVILLRREVKHKGRLVTLIAPHYKEIEKLSFQVLALRIRSDAGPTLETSSFELDSLLYRLSCKTQIFR